jgi:hypothetical protein
MTMPPFPLRHYPVAAGLAEDSSRDLEREAVPEVEEPLETLVGRGPPQDFEVCTTAGQSRRSCGIMVKILERFRVVEFHLCSVVGGPGEGVNPGSGGAAGDARGTGTTPRVRCTYETAVNFAAFHGISRRSPAFQPVFRPGAFSREHWLLHRRALAPVLNRLVSHSPNHGFPP